MNLVTRSDRVARWAAAFATIGFASLAVFQAALAAGANWGHAAWGGDDAHLSAGQRVASATAAIVYVAATLIVLGRAGIIWRARSNAALFRWGMWFLSRSRWRSARFRTSHRRAAGRTSSSAHSRSS